MKRRKMKEMSTNDFEDVVSSQYESYEDDDDAADGDHDDDEDDGELSMVGVNGQNSAMDVDHNDDNYNDDSWRQVADSVVMVSRSNLQQMSSSWSNAADQRSRRKRKPSSSRRYCGDFDRIHDGQSSYNDMNMNKVMCRDAEGGYCDEYQMTDVSKSAARHGSPAYYAAEQLGCRNPPPNEMDYDLRQVGNEEHYHLERDMRPSRHEDEPRVTQYCRENELRDDLVQTRNLDDADMSHYDVEYERNDEVFSLSQCYGQDDIHYDLRPARSCHETERMSEFSRQNDTRPVNHDAISTVSPNYRLQNNPGQVRHREKSNLTQYYRQNEPQVDRRPNAQEEGLRYNFGKSDLQYANRYCEVSSSASQRSVMVSHNAVPIKSSPDDPGTEQHLLNSASLPSSTGYYWSSGYSEGMKDAGGWRSDGLTGTEHFHAVNDHRAAASPLYDSCNLMTNFIKVEDSLNQTACPPASVPLPPPPSSSSSSSSLSSSSSPFCIDDHLKRDLLAPRTASDSRHRRRRRHNAASTAHTPALSRTNNTRLHMPTPSNSTSASTSAGVGYLPTRLPFSLPPVPPGYRLVITHRPTSESADDASQVTQLIIDHPSDATTLIHSNTTATSSQSLSASTDSVTPSRTVTRPLFNSISSLGCSRSTLAGGTMRSRPYQTCSHRTSSLIAIDKVSINTALPLEGIHLATRATTRPAARTHRALVYQILTKSGNSRPNYRDLTIFYMIALHDLEFGR